MACRLHNRALLLSSSRFTHSQVAQGMSQQEPACCRASSQEDESLVLIVSGSLALALVSLQRYLSTCISTVNSLALLREQAQEVQQLKKDLTRLTAEMSSLKTEIEDLRMAMSAMPVEESVQMSAWALKSTGVTIDLQRSHSSFTWPCRLFWFLCDLRPQETFVQSELPRAFQRIRLLIQSNWGKSRYTCIYRVQVHGKVYGVWYCMAYDTVWYGMVWYGMVWYGMVWYGMVWYGMVWYGMASCMVQNDVVYGMAWHGYGMICCIECYAIVWFVVWYGMVWYGMVWYGMVWYGMVWYGMVWYGKMYDMVWYRMGYGVEYSTLWFIVWYRIVYGIELYMVWYGAWVWNGTVCCIECYAIVWYVVWYSMVWYTMVWYGMAWHGMAWHGVVSYGREYNGTLYVIAWCDVWYGIVYGMVWHESQHTSAGMERDMLAEEMDMLEEDMRMLRECLAQRSAESQMQRGMLRRLAKKQEQLKDSITQLSAEGTPCVAMELCKSSNQALLPAASCRGRRSPRYHRLHVRSWWKNSCAVYGMVWYGMVWYGMVWYGMVWYGMVWYGMVWCGMVWYEIVWYGMVWYGMVWYVWYGMVWYGMVWYGMVWYGMVWHGMAWHGVAWHGMGWDGTGYDMGSGTVWGCMVYGMVCSMHCGKSERSQYHSNKNTLDINCSLITVEADNKRVMYVSTAPQKQDIISKMTLKPIGNALHLMVEFHDMDPEFIFL
ncbi:hypothetical protein Q9233_005911 [Columba guinea]|nr:hypothetical protein Q9233_005911 [Columba guinea]